MAESIKSLGMRVGQLLAVCACGALFAAGFALADTATVSLTASGPDPATVTVDWGDTVVFTNVDTVERSVTSQRAPFASGPISPGSSFEHRFEGRAGRYSFVQSGSRPTTSGVVEVVPSGKVSLAVRPATALHGSKVTITGTSSYTGTPVVIEFRQAGASGDWKEALSLVASATGAYSGRIEATAGGRLRARVAGGQIASGLVSLHVQPRVTLRVEPRRVRAGARTVVTGTISPTSAASMADLEMFDADMRSWRREMSRRVSRNGTVRFSFRVAKGRTQLRIVLRRGALQPGFIPIASSPRVIVGF